jgi:hypothetical protein
LAVFSHRRLLYDLWNLAAVHRASSAFSVASCIRVGRTNGDIVHTRAAEVSFVTVPARKQTADGASHFVRAIDLYRPEAYLLLISLIIIVK